MSSLLLFSPERLAAEFLASKPEDRLTPPQAAGVTGFGLPRVNSWMRAGVGGLVLPSIAVGGGTMRTGKRIILRSWLQAWLAAAHVVHDQNESGAVPGGSAA